MEKIGIIGLGLIGGSMGLALRKQNYTVYGFDKDDLNQKKALKNGLVDEIQSVEELIKKSEVIFLAVPVDAIIKLLPKLLDKLSNNKVVVDLGSTKGDICITIANHPKRNQFIPGHPIAGTEYSGPDAAVLNLFQNKKFVICEKEKTNPNKLNKVVELLEKVGFCIIYMDAAAHDKHLAYISHLSHICSFGLSLAVLDIEKNDKNIFHLAGSGFSSTARLAKSSPEMWSAIAIQNKKNLIEALDIYIKKIEELRKFILEERISCLKKSMLEANKIKKIIDKN